MKIVAAEYISIRTPISDDAAVVLVDGCKTFSRTVRVTLFPHDWPTR